MGDPENPTTAERESFDEPWKRALSAFLKEFVELFHPKLYHRVDWSFEPVPQPLSTELPASTMGATEGTRIADLVFKVRLKMGKDLFLVLYLEVQSTPERDFEALVFRRFLRLFERHPIPIETIAILADRSRSWRPRKFRSVGVSSAVQLSFKSIKILDWAERTEELEKSPNPFASFVLAVLATLQTKSGATRAKMKTQILRDLIRKKFPHDQIHALFRAVDQVMKLGKRLDEEVWGRIRQESETTSMTYIDLHDEFRTRGAREGQGRGQG